MTQTSDLGRGALLTLTEAAEACGVSRSTIKRRLPEFKNAQQDSSGSWRVPISDLLGAGLKLRPSSVTQPAETVTQGHDPGQNGAELGQLVARIEALTTELAAERMARQVAEVRASERGDSLDRLTLALKALPGRPQAAEPVQLPTSAPTAPEPVQASPAAPAQVQEPVQSRRGLWARIRGV